MTEQHKLARELAKRACLNSKSTTYLDKKLDVKQTHNYIGAHIEKFVFNNGKVTIYDKEGEEIKQAEVKTTKKPKASPKLSDSADEKSGGDIQ